MAEYRDRTTGEIKTTRQLREENPNISTPKVWNEYTHDAFNVDPVLHQSRPVDGIGQYQHVVRNGAEQDSDGNWVQAWQIVDMFADDDELGTKAEQEAAYQTQQDSQAAERVRAERDRLLSETDWHGLSDVTMSAQMAAYRQALRDITTHANWPYLNDDDWPTKP